MNKLKYLPILFTIAIAVISAPFAQAISFDFTSDHVTGGAGTPPFGTVTLTQTAANVDFNVSLAAGYKFVLTGSADSGPSNSTGLESPWAILSTSIRTSPALP